MGPPYLEGALRVLNAIQRGIDLLGKRMSYSLDKKEERERFYRKLERKINGELRVLMNTKWCEHNKWQFTKTHCQSARRSKFCGYKLLTGADKPVNCKLVAATAKQQAATFRQICCTKW